jgi:glycerophosphoryl diester phosphodiesterase
MAGFEIVAHRGAPLGMPENTIPAFERALELGADALEMDVRLTSDGVPVVFHNFYLDDKTKASGPIFAHTLSEVQELELVGGGKSGQECRIPTFREVLERFSGRMGLEIELKGPEPESAAMVAAELQRFRPLWDSMEVTSYEPALLLDIGRRCRGLAVDLLQRPSEDWMKLDVVAHIALHSARLAGARAVHLHPSQLSPNVVSIIRTAGIEVHSWAVNDNRSLAMVQKLGIPKFDTDNLLLALQFRRGLGS